MTCHVIIRRRVRKQVTGFQNHANDCVICVRLFQLCKKHHFGINKPEKIAQSPDESKFLLKTLNQIKSNVAVPIKKKVATSHSSYAK